MLICRLKYWYGNVFFKYATSPNVNEPCLWAFCERYRFKSYCAFAQPHQRIWLLFLYFTVYGIYVNGQRKPRSDWDFAARICLLFFDGSVFASNTHTVQFSDRHFNLSGTNAIDTSFQANFLKNYLKKVDCLLKTVFCALRRDLFSEIKLIQASEYFRKLLTYLIDTRS